MSAQEPSGKTKNTTGFRFQDIEELLADPSPARRCAGVRRMAAEVERDPSSGDWHCVQSALRRAVNDTELQVRLALATALSGSVHLPRDVACALAGDIFQIAKMIIERSPALNDDDLIRMLGDGNGAVQIAIARRPALSPAVANAVLETRNAAAVTVLAANTGAGLDEPLLLAILDGYGRYETVKTALVERFDLPDNVFARLMTVVPERLKAELMAKKAAAEPLFGSELETHSSAEECAVAAAKAERPNNMLTGPEVLRALCTGNIGLAEEAMAEISGVSVEKASLLIHDDGPFGLKAIYRKCGFAEELFAAFRVAIDLEQETRDSGQVLSPERFEQTVVERILTRYRDIEVADLDYVLSKLSRFEAA